MQVKNKTDPFLQQNVQRHTSISHQLIAFDILSD